MDGYLSSYFPQVLSVSGGGQGEGSREDICHILAELSGHFHEECFLMVEVFFLFCQIWE